ncbi:hypothetical protein ES708_33961 [subsurface metagenome]
MTDVLSTVAGAIVFFVYLGFVFIFLFALGPKRKEERLTFLITLLAYYGFIFIIGRFFPETFYDFKNILFVFGVPAFIVYFAYRVRMGNERGVVEHGLGIGIKKTIEELEALSREIESYTSKGKIPVEYSTGIQTAVESMTNKLISLQKQLRELR